MYRYYQISLVLLLCIFYANSSVIQNKNCCSFTLGNNCFCKKIPFPSNVNGECSCNTIFDIKLIYTGSEPAKSITLFNPTDETEICSFSNVYKGDEITCQTETGYGPTTDFRIIGRMTNRECNGLLDTSCETKGGPDQTQVIQHLGDGCKLLSATSYRSDQGICFDGYSPCSCSPHGDVIFSDSLSTSLSAGSGGPFNANTVPIHKVGGYGSGSGSFSLSPSLSLSFSASGSGVLPKKYRRKRYRPRPKQYTVGTAGGTASSPPPPPPLPVVTNPINDDAVKVEPVSSLNIKRPGIIIGSPSLSLSRSGSGIGILPGKKVGKIIGSGSFSPSLSLSRSGSGIGILPPKIEPYGYTDPLPIQVLDGDVGVEVEGASTLKKIPIIGSPSLSLSRSGSGIGILPGKKVGKIIGSGSFSPSLSLSRSGSGLIGIGKGGGVKKGVGIGIGSGSGIFSLSRSLSLSGSGIGRKFAVPHSRYGKKGGGGLPIIEPLEGGIGVDLGIKRGGGYIPGFGSISRSGSGLFRRRRRRNKVNPVTTPKRTEYTVTSPLIQYLDDEIDGTAPKFQLDALEKASQRLRRQNRVNRAKNRRFGSGSGSGIFGFLSGSRSGSGFFSGSLSGSGGFFKTKRDWKQHLNPYLKKLLEAEYNRGFKEGEAVGYEQGLADGLAQCEDGYTTTTLPPPLIVPTMDPTEEPTQEPTTPAPTPIDESSPLAANGNVVLHRYRYKDDGNNNMPDDFYQHVSNDYNQMMQTGQTERSIYQKWSYWLILGIISINVLAVTYCVCIQPLYAKYCKKKRTGHLEISDVVHSENESYLFTVKEEEDEEEDGNDDDGDLDVENPSSDVSSLSDVTDDEQSRTEYQST